jgi:beta-glucosidase
MDKANSDDWAWYNSSVVYPFGYGMSYTTFDWEVIGGTIDGKTSNVSITKDSTVKISVKVTNTGDYAGKDVVQLYYSAPYTSGGTEKSHVVLGDFTKTDTLQPGQSQIVTLTIDVSDMASYDYKTEKTYVLDAGTYQLVVAEDAHDAAQLAKAGISGDYSSGRIAPLNISEKTLCNTSSTGYTITNQLDDVTNGYLATSDKQLSRADFGMDNPTSFPTAAEKTRALTVEQYKAWDWANDSTDDADDPWYTTEMPTQADAATRPATAEVTLYDLIGKDYDDDLWDKLLDELTIEEMASLIDNGGFKSIAIDYIGKPESWDTDGPKGWTGTGTDSSDAFNKFAAEPVIASTFNKDLAYEMGVMIGEQGLWGNSTKESGTVYSYTGWYAPGMNTHRSPFDSRYTEYYSEDGYLTGMMAANASLGAKSMGAYVCIKHFAFHDDGGGVGISINADGSYNIVGYRGGASKESGLSAWFDEQTAREIYLKPFQIAVEDGEASFAMASFTRVGTTWCGGSYAVNTEILRNEWGFKGAVVTDITIYGFMYSDQMLRAGVDMQLNSGTNHKYIGVAGSTSYSDSIYSSMDETTKASLTATEVSVMRKAAKNILYMVANSNAMQVPTGAKVVYKAPTTTNADGDTVAVEVPAGKVGSSYTFEAGGATFNTYGNYLQHITYSMTGAPEGLEIDATTGKITGTPKAAGTYTVTVTASANYFESSSVDYTIVVTDPNAPVYTTGSDVQGMITTDVNNATKDLASTSDVNKLVDEKTSGVGAGIALGVVGVVLAVVAIAGVAVAIVLIKKKK